MASTQLDNKKPPCWIRLLGPPVITWQTQSFSLARRQARALLYRLADDLHPAPRDQLIFLLWPDTSETTARRNLIRLLSYIHQALPQPELLLSDHTTVALNPDLVGSDAVQFARLGAANDVTGWETAVSLYQGRFLNGFSLPDSPEFDHWLSQSQRQYERAYLDVLGKLVTIKADRGDYPAAIQYAQQYLAADDLAEEIHRQLITLYAAQGDRSAALRQFEQCAIVLERELGVSPLPETRAAYEAARDGTPILSPAVLPKPEWATLPSLDLPLIGRDEAWQALTEAYRRYQNGGVIFISGEAGVGKSRLMQEFATTQSGLVLTGNSHATGQALPYQPLMQALRLALSLRDRWTHTLPIWLAEVSRLLPELRAHFPDLPPPVEVAPEQAQARLFEALTEVFASLATDSPLLLCLDDVHWTDESSLGWLDYVTKRLAGSGMCIFGTYRSHRAERLADWRRTLNRAGLAAPVLLNGLSETAVAELLHQARVKQATAAPLAGRIHAATGGNAFFVLETIRELLGTGNISDDAADLPLPQTVRDAVLRRVSRLTPLSQQMVAVAAVLSPNVRVETLVETAGRGEPETVDSLEELLAHHLLQAEGDDFQFQHDLARHAVYEEISPWRRRLLHRRAAEGLEQLYQTDLAPFYPSLAHHWGRVIEGETADPTVVLKAIEYLQKTGEQAVHSSANQEAIEYFDKAIALVNRLPETTERNEQELNLQIALYAPLGVAKGWAAPEIEKAFKRAQELCEQIGDPAQLFLVLYGLWGYNISRANLQIALGLAEQCLILAQSVDAPALRMEAFRLMDETMFFRGEFVQAREHLEQGYMLYNPQLHHTHAVIYAQDPGVAFLGYGSWILWQLGYPDQACKMSHETVVLGRSLSHLGSYAYALTWATLFHHFERDVAATQKRAEAAIAISTEHGFALFLAEAIIYRGWALVNQGNVDEGIAQIRQGMDTLQKIGVVLVLTNGLAVLAESLAKVGQIDEGLETLNEALDLVNSHEERWWESELYRLKGELLAMQGKPDAQIEANFQQAITIARRQSAKSLELRATVSLARLYQQQDKRAEAHQMLFEIYNWFTEGFDTVELKAARVLLEELL